MLPRAVTSRAASYSQGGPMGTDGLLGWRNASKRPLQMQRPTLARLANVRFGSKLTKPHAEHMFSGLLPIADVSSDQ